MRVESTDKASLPETERHQEASLLPAASGAGRHEFVVRVTMAIGALIGVLVFYELRSLLLLTFAAILFALAIHALADPLVHRLEMSRGPALWISGTLGLLLPLSAALIFGREISTQIEIASQHIPASAEELATLLEASGIPMQVVERLGEFELGESLARFGAQTLANAAEFVGAGVLVLVTGVYLAAQPRIYLDGILVFVSVQQRKVIDILCQEISTELKHWLLAQFVLMVMVGSLTGLGAWVLGVPAPVALGIAAGLLEVVPYLGPILASVPAAALGLSVGLDVAALMLGWIFVVQQIEGLLLTPLVLRKAVRLPPAVSLLALISAGLLFGPVGILLAAPAAVVGFVVYRRLRQRREAANGHPIIRSSSSNAPYHPQ